jgi:hypothetical protein
VLVITGSFDRGSTNGPRNTQVVELTFLERAQPGTFGDWAVRRFSDAQLADVSISGIFADPEVDGVGNLLEFVAAGDPFLADATSAKLHNAPAASGQFALRFRERKNLSGITRQFFSSTDLISWSPATPVSVTPVQDLGEAQSLEAVFAAPVASSFFRISYETQTP